MLLLCLATRLLSTIHYIEDPDSLRFALAMHKYDLADLQPHFPGYPVFCFLAKGIFLLTGRFAYAFSAVGGLATFGIIWAGVQLCRQVFPRVQGWLYALLLFLNPFLWLLANRYMPDLLGECLVLLCLYAYVRAEQDQRRWYLAFFVLAGLLAGVRLSYVPMVMLPALVLLRKPGRWRGLTAGAITVLLWFIPLLLDTGWEPLLRVANAQTEGHFYEWGGTIFSEPSHLQRMLMTWKGLWADGLGGWWPGRSWVSLALSAFLALGAVLAVAARFFAAHPEVDSPMNAPVAPARIQQLLFTRLILLLSAVLYLLWIYYYQNVVHQSRHVLPLVPVLLLPVAAGYSRLWLRHRMAGFVLLTGLLLTQSWLSFTLARQHLQPSSIAQVKALLQEQQDPRPVVASLEMLNFYFERQKVPADFLDVEQQTEQINQAIAEGRTVYLVGEFRSSLRGQPAHEQTFYHNPYVNRLWPVVPVYRYEPSR